MSPIFPRKPLSIKPIVEAIEISVKISVTGTLATESDAGYGYYSTGALPLDAC